MIYFIRYSKSHSWLRKSFLFGREFDRRDGMAFSYHADDADDDQFDNDIMVKITNPNSFSGDII